MTIDICADTIKKQDYGRYVTTLFAPRELRKFLWALYALNVELMNIRHVVAKENMMGLIRLQWWRDSIAAVYNGQTVNHHVLQGLAEIINEATFWNLQDFERLIDAYEEDFLNDVDNLLQRQTEQNEILLQLAIKPFGYDAEHDVIHAIAKHYTQAKILLQNAQPAPHAAHSLQELNTIPRKNLRALPLRLGRDLARYDYMLLRDGKNRSPELYRSLMAFYLWRKNLFL